MTPVPASTPIERTRLTLFLGLLSCLLFGYVALRAYALAITWDEAHNYLEFTRKGILSPFHLPPFAIAANNHFLNTWLTYVTTALLGVSALSLRLPALAAYLLFLYYTARLSAALRSPPLALSAFVILNVNPYLLDFFSLSRGYGLAYGLLAGSLWYLYRFFDTGLRPGPAAASIGLAILGVTAHLTLVHFLITLCIVILLADVLSGRGNRKLAQRLADALRRHSLVGAITCAFLLATFVVVRELRRAGAFFYGGTTSFWRDTVVSIAEHSLYERPYGAWLSSGLAIPSSRMSEALGVAALLAVLLALAVSIRRGIKPMEPRQLYLPALLFLLCACSLATIAQHYVLGVPYLTGRTGLYLWIVFVVVLVALADATAQAPNAGRFWLPAAATLAALHLVGCLNLRYVLEWKEQADVKEMVEDIALAKPATPVPKFNANVGVSLEFEAPLNYYRLVDGLTWLNVADRRMKFHPMNDLYLYTAADWRGQDADSFVVLKTYPLTGARLARRRGGPPRYDIKIDERLAFDQAADSTATRQAASTAAMHTGARSGSTDRGHTRSGGIEYPIDFATLPAATSVLTVRAMVWMQSLSNANAALFVAFERNHQAYYWYHTAVRDGALGARTWFPVYLTCVMPKDVRQGDVVSVYVWNDKSRVYVHDLEMRWLTPAN